MEDKLSFSAAARRSAAISFEPECPYCSSYFLSGLILFCTSFSASSFSLKVPDEDSAEVICSVVFDLTGRRLLREEGKKNINLYDNGSFFFAAREAFHSDPSAFRSVDLSNVPGMCCKKNLLRGAFIAGGTLASPEKDFRLEFSTPYQRLVPSFSDFLSSLDMPPLFSKRASRYLIYYKDVQSIADILTSCGAVRETLKIRESQTEREFSNYENRVVNCLDANIGKTVDASAAQIAAINLLDSRGLLKSLPESLRQAAELRMNNPEDALSELCAKADPPVSKSGLYHRLKRLCEEAEKFENGRA